MKEFGKHSSTMNLSSLGISQAREILWNLTPAELVEEALKNGEGFLTDTGALMCDTGTFTGRSPKDRFVVKDAETENSVWWGDVNIPYEPAKFEQGDHRRDAAFTIFYMGINLGAFAAPLVCGILAEDIFATKTVVDGITVVSEYGFRYGFLAAGIGMVIGQIAFNLLAPKYLGSVGVEPDGKVDKNNPVVKAPLTKEETDRMAVIFIITLFVVFFWAGFEQAGSSLSLYTDKYIDREVFGFLIPTAWFQSVNPLFIVAFAPLTANLWLSLSRRGKDLSIPVKMGLGMILLGLGFLFMVGAVMQRGGNIEDETIKASIFWLIATYFFHTIGELCLSPIGLSMVSRLSPLAYTSMLMGVWFLAPFVAQIAGGYIAAYVEILGPLQVFGLISGFVIAAGLLLVALAKKLLYMMHGRGA